MKRLKRFNEFFDSEKLRDESGIELDFGGNFLTKYFKNKKNQRNLKAAAEKAIKGITLDKSKTEGRILYILRECPLLRSEYFRVNGGKHKDYASLKEYVPNLNHNVIFDYFYKHEDTQWRLLIIINIKTFTVMTAYEANIYGHNMISHNDKMYSETIEEMTHRVNKELVPKILSWGKETQTITGVNPIPYKEEELFSPGNN